MLAKVCGAHHRETISGFEMTQGRGSIIAHIREFAVERGGETQWDQLLDEFPEADKRTLRSVISIGWYDVDLILRTLRTTVRVLATQGDASVLREMGRFCADKDLKFVHRLFLRLANPAYVLEKAGDYWGRFWDRGHWTIERQGENAARGTLRDFPGDETMCSFNTFYIERMFELVGAKDVKCTHVSCRHRGGAACVFQGSWK